MNAFARLFRFGAEDADRRVASFLRPRDCGDAERYLLSSVSLGAIDRATSRLERWWFESRSGRALITLAGQWSRESRSSRNQSLGLIFLAAAATHVSLLIWQGPPPQFFWLLLPALAAAAGVLLLASARAGNLRRDD